MFPIRLLLTGGCGFIGSALVRDLLGTSRGPGAEDGPEVERLVNLDKMTYAAHPDNLAELAGDSRLLTVPGDIGDVDLVEALFDEHRFDAVLHLAAESHVDRSIDSPAAFVETNVLGTFRLLEAARHFLERLDGAAARRFRFVHVSTDEVYGELPPDDPPLPESAPLRPGNPYAASKAGGDHLVASYWRTYRFPAVVARSSNNYGPRQFPEKLIPLAIEKLRRGGSLPLYGDGSQRRQWIHVDDHCRALRTILFEGRPGEVYHVGGDEERSNREVARLLVGFVEDRLHWEKRGDPEERLAFVADRPGHDRRYAVDSSKLRRELGWRPRVSFEEGLRETVRWYFENEAWLGRVRSGPYQGGRLGLLS